MSGDEEKEQKPQVADIPVKSSMEILSELFNCFDAEPPLIIKKEKTDSPKKNKKSKKKHKHKEKKHKKKDKKKRRSSSSSSDKSELDLAEILIKQEKESSEQKIKIEGTDLSISLNNIKKGVVKKEKVDDTDIKKEDSKSDKVKVDTTSVKTENIEDGEISNSGDENQSHKRKKKKHKHDLEKVKKIKKEVTDTADKSKNKERHSEDRIDLQLKIDDLRNKIKANQQKDKRSRSKDRRSRSRSPIWEDRHREHRSRDRERYKDKYKEHEYRNKKDIRENPFYREKDDDFWLRDRHQSHYSKDRDRERDRGRDRDRDRRHRVRSSSRDASHIDKKKLLEIARKNAIQMMKSGNLPGALTLGPQAQEKVIAAIKAGGKTIEELTDFCKTLSKKEALGELSSNSDGNGSDSDTDKPFHHPFQLKDRPTSITINIKNSVPLPIKSTQEKTSELRLQFPVSSGQLHRKTENEWVPVTPKKPSTTSNKPAPATAPLPIEAPPIPEVATVAVPIAPGPQVFPPVTSTESSNVDIGSIVSQRLSALRKLQENPNDVQALTEVYKSNKEMQSWAQSKQQPGQFTGSTGAQIMSAAELSSGYQAWAKKAFVRLQCQGSTGCKWLSLVVIVRGSTNFRNSSIWWYGYASSTKNGMETG